jgi:U3-containing 90S pre-ribosomal complex subunit
MGGDDLASDDEYFVAPVRAGNDDDDDDDKDSQDGSDTDKTGNLKRQQNPNSSSRDDDPPSKKQKSRKQLGGGKIEEVGRRIVDESVQRKAELLSEYTGVEFLSQNIASERPDQQRTDTSSGNNSCDDLLADRLVSFISKKQLKKPQQQGHNNNNTKSSPRVLILALSARRAVAILKELAPLRLQVAKLFPKQGTCQEQARQLAETNFIAAVGTPQRLKDLLDRGSLSLSATQLVLLDTFQNGKNFSVYTLPDTAPFCIDVLKDHVQPECCRRPKRIKVGFV